MMAGRRADRRLVVGFLIVGVMIVPSAASLIWTPHDIASLDIGARFATPGWPYVLGTDQFGRDTLSMIMVGGRTSIAIAFVAVLAGAAIGIPLGLLASARGGLADEVVMRGNDLLFAFPALLSALMLTAAFGPGAVNAVIAIAIFNIPVFARVTRGSALPIWRMDYVTAARVAGRSRSSIAWEHVLPNIASLLIVQATIQFSVGILQEAGLSYVGLGARAPSTSWGQMLAQAQTMTAIAPRLALLPGLVIVVFVIGLNMVGTALRDALDPRLGGTFEAR